MNFHGVITESIIKEQVNNDRLFNIVKFTEIHVNK